MATLTKLRALTVGERTELERLARSRTEEARLVIRAKIVLGLAAGQRPYRVAEQVGVGRAAAYEWLHRFNAEGLKGLTDHPRPGRPHTYTPDQRAEVAAALTKPESLGLPFASWTLMGYFRTIPPELEECAMIDGCSRVGILWKVILALSIPGLLSAGIFAFTLSWN